MNSPDENSLESYVLGIDVGGTHTDIELIDVVSGRIFRHKIPSTPANPSLAIRRGTAEIVAQAGISGKDIRYFANGTTVATNALVQERTVSGIL